MPDHLHMIAPIVRRRRRRTLAAVLGGFANVFRLGELWLPVAEPEPLRTPDKIARGIRYVALNACRPWRYGARVVQLAADPLEWTWSTMRDVVGAVTDPWCTAETIAEVAGLRAGGSPRATLHRYVSADPSVSVSGTPLPKPRPPSTTPDCSLATIALATVAACRGHERDIARRGEARSLFAALAHRQGHRQVAEIARTCGVHPDTVMRLVRGCPPASVEAGALCLGDRRLLRGAGPIRPVNWSAADVAEPDARDWPSGWPASNVG